jgi:7-keto-8-aminopelargonate synthetase-like enzyme
MVMIDECHATIGATGKGTLEAGKGRVTGTLGKALGGAMEIYHCKRSY